MDVESKSLVTKNKMKTVLLTSGKDSLPLKIKYINKEGDIKYYKLIETKNGKLRLENHHNI